MRLRNVSVKPGFCILLSVLLLTVPLKWMAAALIAGAVHEAGHIFALRLLKKDIFGMEFGLGKTQIVMENSAPWEELAAAVAGPLAGALLIPAYRYIPRIAICAAIQTAYNCIPIYPLDGGRALYCLSRLLFGETRAKRILDVFRYLTAAVFMLTAILIVKVLQAWSVSAVLLFLSIFAVKKNTLQKSRVSGTIGETRR